MWTTEVQDTNKKRLKTGTYRKKWFGVEHMKHMGMGVMTKSVS